MKFKEGDRVYFDTGKTYNSRFVGIGRVNRKRTYGDGGWYIFVETEVRFKDGTKANSLIVADVEDAFIEHEHIYNSPLYQAFK